MYVGEVWYTEGHPEGYTDDLGIIADSNRWVSAELPGWYVNLSGPYDWLEEVARWCQENLSPGWSIRNGRLRMCRHNDTVLLKMRWK